LDLKILAFFVKNSNYHLFLHRRAKFGEDQMILGWIIAYSWFSNWLLSAIFDFHIFAVFVKNSNLRLFLRPSAKFGEDRTICGRVIVYFQFSKWRPSAILDLV